MTIYKPNLDSVLRQRESPAGKLSGEHDRFQRRCHSVASQSNRSDSALEWHINESNTSATVRGPPSGATNPFGPFGRGRAHRRTDIDGPSITASNTNRYKLRSET